MLPKQHILLGFIFALISWPLFGIMNSLIIFFSSFLIDVDHLFNYFIRKRDLSIKRAYHYCRAESFLHEIHIFHTAEFWTVLFLFSYSSDFFLFCLIGVLYHNILDFLEMVLKRWYNVRVYSLLLWLILRFK